MDRQDANLAFMLRYENIAWYEDGEVRVLDLRVYPAKTSFVVCRTHVELAKAITDMVTQSAGPFTAAPMGMALAAWECRDMTAEKQMEHLRNASYTISHARPTTVNRMKIVTEACLPSAEKALSEGKRVDIAIRDFVVEANNMRYAKVGRCAKYLVDMFPDNGTVMTQCFAETILGMMLKECSERGKRIRLFCPETRPYFQGARLTATVCHDMGFGLRDEAGEGGCIHMRCGCNMRGRLCVQQGWNKPDSHLRQLFWNPNVHIGCSRHWTSYARLGHNRDARS